MSNDPNERKSEDPIDGPSGSIDDDSIHPSAEPEDDTTGNVDPVVPLGNPDEKEGNEPTTPPQDARLMGPAGN
jgi:hypothetical protein